MMAIFSVFGVYFFGKFEDKAARYYMAISNPLPSCHCQPVIDCKMNDLERP